MQKIAIIHYLPLEYYPPVTNLLDYLESNDKYQFDRISIFSCKNVKGRKPYASTGLVSQSSKGSTSNQISNFGSKRSTKKKSQSHNFETAANELVAVKRSPFPKESDSNVIRLYKYLHFNIRTLIGLITSQPNNLLYFESYSAWPAYIYTKYFNRKCRIFIHNHEYADKGWYRNTMKQVKYFHQLEKKWLYPRAQWISQTNSDRLQFFHQDHPSLKPEQLKIMPNYPSLLWRADENKLPANSYQLTTLRVVYVGALTFKSTYLKEVCEWILKQDGKVQFDVFAYNLYSDIKTYLQELNSPFINYYEQGIEYNDQPKLLEKYDVGLILYRAHDKNYTYNAPNKLFEYLACGLDVWFPDVLQGPQPYNTSNTYPKVIPIDFEKLDNFNLLQAMDKTDCEHKPSTYFCEEVYEELINELMC